MRKVTVVVCFLVLIINQLILNLGGLKSTFIEGYETGISHKVDNGLCVLTCPRRLVCYILIHFASTELPVSERGNISVCLKSNADSRTELASIVSDGDLLYIHNKESNPALDPYFTWPGGFELQIQSKRITKLVEWEAFLKEPDGNKDCGMYARKRYITNAILMWGSLLSAVIAAVTAIYPWIKRKETDNDNAKVAQEVAHRMLCQVRIKGRRQQRKLQAAFRDLSQNDFIRFGHTVSGHGLDFSDKQTQRLITGVLTDYFGRLHTFKVAFDSIYRRIYGPYRRYIHRKQPS